MIKINDEWIPSARGSLWRLLSEHHNSPGDAAAAAAAAICRPHSLTHSQEACAHYGFIQALCSPPAPARAVVPERLSCFRFTTVQTRVLHHLNCRREVATVVNEEFPPQDL